MAEIVTLISTQGMPILVTAVLLIGIIKGVPKFFKWCGIQWEDIKNIFKNYMCEQVEAIKEVREGNKEILKSNKEIVEMSRSIFKTNEGLVATVIDFTMKVDGIETKVDDMSEDIKIIKERITEKDVL